ncbi:DegT/DnrJ/EryC1/StrS aminotransferase family protein [Roseovarius nubinhibens]|uniref:Aminotransferase DegT n=1 Tax=Roseovarius nubinhibens TaxID=314263 RepID=A0A348WA13_9RHOB|nr:aminotransferase DegT [Roseovarius nubinhibens]|tara:strand:- start:820 stop:1938 length:1119 start_codon:yes stop_codon:yes gene_type:complete
MQFIDLQAQQARLRGRIDAAIARVLDHGAYIMGPEVAEFEEKLAAYCGADHCISCANGTDALQLALMALGLKAGDAVFVPSFTFAATAEVVPGTGATPVFVDIDPVSYNMDGESLERAIAHAKELGLRPAAVIPVDLFGLPADYDRLVKIADDEGMVLISDSAQGFGGRRGNKMTGTFGKLTTTSFFPAKPLGCYGDGGAIFTDDSDLAALLDSLRVHGKGSEKYDNVRIGLNSRLDTIQAAILLVKLEVYAEEVEARQRVAKRYSEALEDLVDVPQEGEGVQSVWAQYTVGTKGPEAREQLMSALKAEGIPSAVYYPRPLHTQTGYKSFPQDPQGLPVSDAAAARVFSLPMHPYLNQTDQDRVIEAVVRAC